MSPTRKPSTVTSLRKAVAAPASEKRVSEMTIAEIQTEILAMPAPPVKPVRVTLNFPPELFRQLTRWCDFAAGELGAPRISVQNALRAMVWTGVADASPSSPVLDELRRTAR